MFVYKIGGARSLPGPAPQVFGFPCWTHGFGRNDEFFTPRGLRGVEGSGCLCSTDCIYQTMFPVKEVIYHLVPCMLPGPAIGIGVGYYDDLVIIYFWVFWIDYSLSE